MRILHGSDYHGKLFPLKGNYDTVVFSGDFFPDCPYQYSDKNKYAAFQLQWLESQIFDIKKWLNGHPILMIGGNHDFLSYKIVEKVLKDEGINCIDLNDKLVTHDLVNFYGFPYIPVIDESFNYELDLDERQEKVDEMVSILNSTKVDVLVCHAAAKDILDVDRLGYSYGCPILADAFMNKIHRDMLPEVVCHGHIHSPGITVKNGILFSNAATFQHTIEL